MTKPPWECDGDELTRHIRLALDGDAGSLARLVERLTPWLLAQATWRAHNARLRSVDPEDVVQRAWEIVLAKLFPRALHGGADEPQVLRDRDGHLGPVLRRYLATTVLRILNGLSQQRLRERMFLHPASNIGISSWPAATSDALAKVLRGERTRTLIACIEALEPADRAILLMAAVEDLPREEIARRVGEREIGARPLTSGAVRVRLHRIREKLRACCGENEALDDFEL
jgi:DNA-directed RNA polymerase specialized sigma24 family protein